MTVGALIRQQVSSLPDKATNRRRRYLLLIRRLSGPGKDVDEGLMDIVAWIPVFLGILRHHFARARHMKLGSIDLLGRDPLGVVQHDEQMTATELSGIIIAHTGLTGHDKRVDPP